MKLHGHYRYDSYNDIRHDKKWQARIIKREEANFERWVELVAFQYDAWRKSVFGRSDPEIESIPEKYGEYIYFLRHKEYSQKLGGGSNTNGDKKKEDNSSNLYEIYCRHKHSDLGKFQSQEDA